MKYGGNIFLVAGQVQNLEVHSSFSVIQRLLFDRLIQEIKVDVFGTRCTKPWCYCVTLSVLKVVMFSFVIHCTYCKCSSIAVLPLMCHVNE